MAGPPHTLLILSSGLSEAMFVNSAVPSQNPSVASAIMLTTSLPLQPHLLSAPPYCLSLWSTVPLPHLLPIVTALTPLAARYTSTHPRQLLVLLHSQPLVFVQGW